MQGSGQPAVNATAELVKSLHLVKLYKKNETKGAWVPRGTATTSTRRTADATTPQTHAQAGHLTRCWRC